MTSGRAVTPTRRRAARPAAIPRSSPAMHLADFRRAGHWPTLVSAFVYFDLSFLVWVLIGALGNALSAEFGLSPSRRG